MTVTLKQLVEDACSRVAVVSPGDAARAAENGDLVLDVRESGELESEGRVPGALHVPRGVLESRADPAAQAAEPRLTGLRGTGRVQVLCASGGRAALAADTLRKMGYAAAVIEGGMNAWKAQGLPVER